MEETAMVCHYAPEAPQHLLEQGEQGSRSRREPVPTGTTRILLVIMKGTKVHVSVDDLFWVFSQFGIVEKMSSFSKNSKNQLLVQYEQQEHAGAALSYLNGRDLLLLSGYMCRLEIVPSFLRVLTFKKLDSRNRDFSSLNDDIRQVFPGIGKRAAEAGWAVRQFLWGLHVYGEGWLEPLQSPVDLGRIPRGAAVAGGLPQGQVGDCVKLSGVSEEAITAEGLFRIASMYGSVVSAKMMAKRRGCALVQFRCREEALNAIQKLDGATVLGSMWEAVPSKHANALHWDGAGTELQTRMCTFNDVEQPETPDSDLSGSPSHYLAILGVPDEEEAAEVLREALEPFHPAEVSAVGGEYGAVAGFQDSDQAFLAAAAVNGKTVSGRRVSLYFVQTPADDDDGVDAGSSGEDEGFSGVDVAPPVGTYRTKTDDFVGSTGSFSLPADLDPYSRQRTL